MGKKVGRTHYFGPKGTHEIDGSPIHSGYIGNCISPRNAIPYVSRVDGGTVDLVRSFGAEVVSSADFLPHFTAVLTEREIESQVRAAQALDQIVQKTWKWIREHLGSITEYDAQQKIAADFRSFGLVAAHSPIVAVGSHSADPHYL